ncbi:hypothetical protein [Dyadobacter psychrotolerans]|nr:hypothetical protein [Dyadobacter psychrotolerans]
MEKSSIDSGTPVRDEIISSLYLKYILVRHEYIRRLRSKAIRLTTSQIY